LRAANAPRYIRKMDNKEHPPNDLLVGPPRVVNVGLELFATDLAALGAKVVHVQWSPPAGGNARLAGLLDKLRET
jgi:FdrA protein